MYNLNLGGKMNKLGKIVLTVSLIFLLANQSWALEKVKVQLVWVKQG